MPEEPASNMSAARRRRRGFLYLLYSSKASKADQHAVHPGYYAADEERGEAACRGAAHRGQEAKREEACGRGESKKRGVYSDYLREPHIGADPRRLRRARRRGSQQRNEQEVCRR